MNYLIFVYLRYIYNYILYFIDKLYYISFLFKKILHSLYKSIKI